MVVEKPALFQAQHERSTAFSMYPQAWHGMINQEQEQRDRLKPLNLGKKPCASVKINGFDLSLLE
jgi:hypothetical protein